jgi:membrane peptidoglycan carboxypeptidase
MRPLKYFKQTTKPGQVVRLQLIQNRLKKNRQRSKVAGLGTGLAGFILGLTSLLIVTALVMGSFQITAILKELPDISILERLVGSHGQMYQPVLFYDRSGQGLIPGNDIGDPVMEYVEFSGITGNEGPSLLSLYVEHLVTMTTLDDPTEPSIYQEEDRARTIPERLVSDLLISDEPVSYARNIRLRLLAAQANTRYGEDQLLSWYLNSTNYGRNVRGAAAAARYYFNKSLDQMNPGELLVLAVISLAPEVNAASAPDAFDKSLQQAVTHLSELGLIDESIMQQARSARESINAGLTDLDNQTTAFIATAREQLSEDTNNSYPDQGGIKVITSMDAGLQTRLVCALYDMLDEPVIQANCAGVLLGLTRPLPEINAPDDLVINFVLLDPAEGRVLAMLGDYSAAGGEQSFLNPHSASSLVTPFIYLSGLLQGMSPATLVWDTPTDLDESTLAYYPDRRVFKGPMSVRTAMSGDHLAPAAKLMADYGKENVLDLLSSFGLHLYESEGIPYTSGIADSLSIAQAYGIFANTGIRAGNASQSQSGDLTPSLILRALDENGTVILEKSEYQEQTLVSPELAWLINDMLASPGVGNQMLRGSTKTGFSMDGMDYWRVAYAPEYVFVVYMGYSDPIGKPGLNELGIDSALVNIVEETLIPSSPWDGWVIPEGITRQEVCIPSGLLPGEACPQTGMEYFLTGTYPSEIDSLYQAYPIDTETGRRATVFTDPTKITKQVFFNPPIEEMAWAREAGYPLAPADYAVFQSGSSTGSMVIVAPMNFASVKGQITVSGQIEPTGFVSYRMDLGTGLAPTQWLQVGASMTDLPQGKKLGTLDTIKYANGLYTIRIQVLRQGNLADNSYAVILIDNPTK